MDGLTRISSEGGWWLAAAFVAVLVATVALEQRWPAFAPRPDAAGRLRANTVLGLLTLAVQALTYGAAAAAAGGAHGDGVTGLLPALGLAGGWLFAASLAVVSLAQYALHRAAHRWRWLWRLHRVHHADTALDVTTAFRHHPAEPLVGFAWFAAVGVVAGVQPAALALYGLAATLLAIPQHADLSLGRAERWLAPWLVTPGVHHVHHSADQADTDSNYGDLLPLWDRLFGSWRPLDAATRRALRIGLGDAADATAHRLGHQLGARDR